MPLGKTVLIMVKKKKKKKKERKEKKKKKDQGKAGWEMGSLGRGLLGNVWWKYNSSIARVRTVVGLRSRWILEICLRLSG